MSTITAQLSDRTEMASLVAGVDFVPGRLDGADVSGARQLLSRDGAVILTGWPPEPESTVRAAAAVFGTRLRWLETVAEWQTDADEGLALHTDGAHIAVDVHGSHVQVRDFDIDYVLVHCVAQAPVGGGSFVVDGYRLVERLREGMPELYDFLTTVDVDFTSAGQRPVSPPRVGRMVEWTRGGRMIVRARREPECPQPRPLQTTRSKQHEPLLDRYCDVLTAVNAQATAAPLAAGEILFIDNYLFRTTKQSLCLVLRLGPG